MIFGYAKPFTFQLGRAPTVKITDIRDGVTEIHLSNGKLVRASLRITGIRSNPEKPGSLDISYAITTEIVDAPEIPTHPAHTTLQ
jgi:hypothetical protein